MSIIISQGEYCLNSPKSYFIRFYPNLGSAIGNQSTALIVDRLEYWFGRNQFKKGFYKFFEPCSNKLYKNGDSWLEEVGLARRVFNRAFALIGERYISKTEFHAAEDKFKGKPYASYYDRKTNRTYYVRNHAFANQYFQNLFKRDLSSKRLQEKPIKDKSDVEQQKPGKLQGRSCNDQKRRSFRGTIGGSLTNKQKNTSFIRSINSNMMPKITVEDQQTAEKMKNIWMSEVGELGVRFISSALAQRMCNALNQTFQGSLDKWKQYCRQIASSKCLMGEGRNKDFKPWIAWAIKLGTVERIEAGEFVLGDRPTKIDCERERINTEIQALAIERKMIENGIDRIKQEITIERKRAVRQTIEALELVVLEKLREEFCSGLSEKDGSLYLEFQEKRWDSLYVCFTFDTFLKQKVEQELFRETPEQLVQQRLAQTTFIRDLEKLDTEINKWREKFHNLNQEVVEGSPGEESTNSVIRKNDLSGTNVNSYICLDETQEPQLIREIKNWFAKQFGEITYISWFRDISLLGFDGIKLSLKAKSNFIRDFVNANYGYHIREFMMSKFGYDICLEFS